MRTCKTAALILLAATPARSLLFAQTLEERLLSEPVAALVEAAREAGDAKRGAIVFHQPQMACTKCHALGGRENSLGPDLTRLPDDASDAHLVESVLQPSKRIRKGYEATTLVLADGRVVTGMSVRENADSDPPPPDDGGVTLRDPSTGRVLAYTGDQIDERVVSPQSIMPPQQVNQLASRQQFLDLIAYLIAVRAGGPARARELQPPASLFALRLPEYEKRVDHAGLIRDLDDEAFNRGQAIYERLCINCHGDHQKPGSLPTALRFAEGKFKNGSDPFTMYQTLTRGFGFMVPQSWMVPQQKYDAIHYIREAYLKEHNPSQYFAISDPYVAGLPKGNTKGPKPRKYEPWSDMNYGPQLVGTVEIPGSTAVRGGRGTPTPNIAYKGIAVRLDAGAGGVSQGNAWTVFDHDTMRTAGAWTAAAGSQLRFIDWQGIHFNGRHGTHPTAVGEIRLSNPVGPGWADPKTGSFDDDQRVIGRDGRRYGPLPRRWAQFHGFHAHEEKTVLRYSVGRTDVLEMPGLLSVSTGTTSQPADENAPPPETTVFTRTFNLGERPEPLTVLVATHPRPSARLETSGPLAVLSADDAGEGESVESFFNGRTYLQVDEAADFPMEDRDFTISARIRTTRGGTILAKTAPVDEWVPGGKVFFVRGGRLCYDVGWVGVLQSRRRVDDGEWHDVAVTRNAGKGLVRLYVDGEIAAKGKLASGERLESQVVRIGYCAPDFPTNQSAFQGDLQDVRFVGREVTPAEFERTSNRAAASADESLVAQWSLQHVVADRIEDASGHGHEADVHTDGTSNRQDDAILAGLSVEIPGAEWGSTGGRLTLTLPAGSEPLRFVLWTTVGAGDSDVAAGRQDAVQFEDPQPDLTAFTRGGTPRWPERVTTQWSPGDDSEPFAVDELLRPTGNPWLARTRLTGLDFFEDPDRMVVTSWDGDVWLVTGLAAAGEGEPALSSQLTWQRIASGLFQPLGVKVVRGDVYVTCRDQLVVLRDVNGDGETDFYECFNSDHQVTEHFHEFAMGLQLDQEGNFYYAKSARHALPALVPHHGTLLRVTPDGKRTDILANGFRAANGVCLNPDGTFIVTDQEGHWNPKNRINWVTPGVGTDTRFYGNMFGYHDVTDESDEAMEPPLCWITNAFDRSPSELLWVDSQRWGTLNGTLLNLSYGYGKVYVVPHEEVDGLKQGGLCALPIDQRPTGTMRGRFSPHDGHLYVCGMFAWGSSQQTQEGGLYRIRKTDRPAYLPVGLRATGTGLVLTFSDPVDPGSARDAENYAIKVWSLKRSAKYGSDHHDERPLDVVSADVSPDGRSVTLQIPEIAPTWCMEIRCRLVGADGEPFERVVHNTIHRLGE